ncbi:leucyl/phenylalanyl-tRNA--protein transferase [Spongiivirga citrea]|uniref:Leucyl/phenylalanyl-tRNA--protein transferase n=1 Tax=Spongiivirga citrea TaxID=1481457 RepID=A0A6M0CJ16_9FLAO|nr:leucyl/phenylalanyl-tRNA--protein transferase [Spongiivirga citrea]NER16983.1 leucyl/phenylalanyl-tRNA--protein transferase [Spongiivirga citrea]
MFLLTDKLEFPPVTTASDEGVVAIGGDLSAERLLLAYENGIFPWSENDDLLLWWSPDPRMVLFPDNFKISKSLRKKLRSNTFEITLNAAFDEVINKCAQAKRKGQEGTWITNGMINAYRHLHEMGKAISVEVWQDSKLVGGLYGLEIDRMFCGESMFHEVSDASKIAFACLVDKCKSEKKEVIDCQVYTEHLNSLGAQEISRSQFLEYLS